MPKRTAITAPGDLNPHGSFEYEPQEVMDQGYKEGFAYALSWSPGRPVPAAINSSVEVGHKYNAEYVSGYKEGYADGMAMNKSASKKVATASVCPFCHSDAVATDADGDYCLDCGNDIKPGQADVYEERQQWLSSRRTASKKTASTGFSCKLCGGESPVGIGYADPGPYSPVDPDCPNFHVVDGSVVSSDGRTAPGDSLPEEWHGASRRTASDHGIADAQVGDRVCYEDMSNPPSEGTVVELGDNPWSAIRIEWDNPERADNMDGTSWTDGRQRGWSFVSKRKTSGIGPVIREGRECDPSVILQQIGSMNVMAISGGRSSAVYDSSGRPVGVSLPVSNGYSVVVYLDFSDTYVVERCFRDNVKGSLDYVYSDQVGEIAYRASCFHDDFGGHEASRKKNTMPKRRRATIEDGQDVECTRCGTPTNPLATFPGGICLDCYESDYHPMPTADELTEMWGGPSRRAKRRRTASEWNRDLSELDQTISDPQWWEEGGPGRGAADVASVPTPGAENSYPQPSSPDMDTAISDEAPEEWPGQEVDGQGAEGITTENADIDLEKVEAFRRRILAGLRREAQRRSQTREAAFSDVRAKAREIFAAGNVDVEYVDADTIVAHVASTSGSNYKTELVFKEGSRAMEVWVCECPWNQWRNQGNGYGSDGLHRYEGRMCSHALATYYQWCSAKGYSVQNPPGLEASSARRPSRRRKGRRA